MPRRSRKFRPASVGPSFELRFDPTNARFACCGRSIFLWDVQQRVKVGQIHPFKHPSHINWSLNGNLLAAKNTSGELVVIEGKGSDFDVHWIYSGAGEGCEIAFSACGNYLVNGSWDGKLEVLDLRNGAVAFSETIEHAMISRIAYSASRSIFAYVVSPKAKTDNDPCEPEYVVIRKWPFWDHRPVVAPYRKQGIEALTFSPNEQLLLLAATDLGAANARLQIYDIERASIEAETSYDFYASGTSVAWNPDSSLIANIENEGVRLYDSQLCPVRFRGVEYPSYVEFSVCGKNLGVGAWGKGFVCSVEEFLDAEIDDA